MNDPSPSTNTKPGPVRPTSEEPEIPDIWTLYIKDRACRPISGLNCWLHIDDKVLPFTTGTDGQIAEVPRSDKPIKVEVEKVTGGRKQVAELKLLPSTGAVVLTSPKMKHEGRTRVHEVKDAGPSAPPPSSYGDWIREAMKEHIEVSGVQFAYQCHSQNEQERYHWKPSPQLEQLMKESAAPVKKGIGRVTVPVLGQGNSIQTRDPKGNPVTIVGVESWDGQLALGVNEKWRPALQEAMELPSVQKTGIKIFALAAVINSEAGTDWITETVEVPVKDKHGNTVIDPKTKQPKVKKKQILIDNGWRESAHNEGDPKGDAAGLTQFIKSTWRGMAASPETQLGQYARKQSWIVEKEILASENHVQLNDKYLSQRLERLEKARQAYEAASKKPVGHGKNHQKAQPPKTMKRPFIVNAGDDAKLLALRDDGRISILTSAEGMAMNFGYFRNKGFQVDSIKNSFELARLAYYLHFLGPADGADLAQGKMSEDHAKYLLLNQFGGSEAKAIKSKLLDSSIGEDRWNKGLWSFTQFICDDRMKNGFEKYCEPTPSSAVLGRKIKDIVEGIKP